MGVLVFAYGKWVKGMDFVEIFQAVVGIAVSVIPEGLPALITITLAIGVQRMAQRNAIIRRLPAVETLGSVSRICSDKTGTLTLMEMMVVSAVTAESEYQVTGDGYAPEGEMQKDGKPVGKDPVLELLGRVSMLCNDAELFHQDGVWKVEGDPTEGALYPFATKLGMDRQAEQSATRGSTPFHSSRSTSSWRRSIKQPAARRCCWSRVRPRSFSSTATGSKPLPANKRRFARPFHAGLRQARRPRRACIGIRVA